MESGKLFRHNRQAILSEVGLEGQKRLTSAKVLCVGAGGLGCPALLYLAAAGVGKLGIVDSDRVEVTNLQRQILFKTMDQDRVKVDAAKDRLLDLDPNLEIETFPDRLTLANATQIFKGYDLVIDGTDNFGTKFLINDVAAQLDIPVVFGSATGFEAQISVFWAKHGPCYRCVYPAPPKTRIANCAESGVIGALTGTVGSLQAMEAIKLILGGTGNKEFSPLIGRLLVMDLRNAAISTFQIEKKFDCPICSTNSKAKFFKDDYLDGCSLSIESNINEMTSQELEHALATLSDIQLIDVRETCELERGFIPGSFNAPLSLLEREIPDFIDSDRLLVTYCQKGQRSLRAATLLMSKGVKRVFSLKGGINAWQGDLLIPEDPPRAST